MTIAQLLIFRAKWCPALARLVEDQPTDRPTVDIRAGAGGLPKKGGGQVRLNICLRDEGVRTVTAGTRTFMEEGPAKTIIPQVFCLQHPGGRFHRTRLAITPDQVVQLAEPALARAQPILLRAQPILLRARRPQAGWSFRIKVP